MQKFPDTCMYVYQFSIYMYSTMHVYIHVNTLQSIHYNTVHSLQYYRHVKIDCSTALSKLYFLACDGTS